MESIRLQRRHLVPAVAGAALYAGMLVLCFVQEGALAPEALDRHVGDDSYYFLQIAHNLVAGEGSCFSPGEPTNGYHPLWLWVVTALRAVLPVARDAMALLAVGVGALFLAASAAPLQLFLERVGATTIQARCCAMVYALFPSIACLAINGMETGLFLLLLFAFLAAAADRSAPTAGRSVGFGVLAGLLMLARTDAIFFTAPVFVTLLLTRRRTMPWLVAAGAVASLLLAPWLVWSLLTFGTIEQSSSDAIAMMRHAQLDGSVGAWWAMSHETFARMLYTVFAFPLHRFATFHPAECVTAGGALACAGVLVALHRLIRPRWHVPLPPWFWGPALGLLVYYAGMRHFLQVWHLSTVVALVAIVAGGLIANLPSAGRHAAWWLLAAASLWSTHNGFFAPQDGGIEFARTYAAGPHPHQVIGNSDGGRFAYFGRDEVVNLDGIVNNRALQHIRAGRLSDYMVERGFDLVMMEPERLEFYDRNVVTAPVDDRPPPATEGDAIVLGKVDSVRLVTSGASPAVYVLEGWVGGGGLDTASTVPLVALLDGAQRTLAVYRGRRHGRADVMQELCDGQMRFAGCRFELASADLPYGVHFVRLGAKGRRGTFWTSYCLPLDPR